MEHPKLDKLNTSDLAAIMKRESLASDKETARKMIDGVFGAVRMALFEAAQKEEAVELRILNFGTFAIKTSPGCVRRDPRTGEKIQVPPRKRMNFRPCTEIKATLKGGFE